MAENDLLSTINIEKIAQAAINLGNEFSYYNYIKRKAHQYNISYDELLYKIRRVVIEKKYKYQMENVKHYHATSLESFEEIIKIGSLMSRNERSKIGISTEELLGSSSINVQFSRDYYDENGNLIETGYGAGKGVNSSDVVFVFGNRIFNEESFDASMLYPTVEKLEIKDNCIAVIVNNKEIYNKVSEILKNNNMNEIKIFLSDQWDINMTQSQLEQTNNKAEIPKLDFMTDSKGNVYKVDKNTFDTETYKCTNFIEGLNKCNSSEEVKNYIDSIISTFSYNENKPQILGSSGSLMSKSVWSNNGRYDDFIDPSIKVSNATLGYSYKIYDNDYLYDFAIGIRKMNLKSNSNILPYVMKFLDYYFGFPKDNIDRRDDVLYNFAVQYAEDFYNKHNIPINPEMSAVDQMQINGDFPLSALKHTFSAQCVERSALAQNIMKVCGYNSSIMYGDCESRGNIEGHCWNAITDKNGNIMIIDYSNTVYSYKNGEFLRREPYASFVSEIDYLLNDGIIEIPDYYYENGKKILANINRKYAVGKSLNFLDENNIGNKLK